ncbi:hypothetical protein MPTK1_7g08640 [Marchantia polymorpha subsp. ruderalis]|uniref:Uncharacterized protein n=2 Tax=Marchantia polymorpha TaxID=3197 RepID=A0AAF6BXH3_MARPO|nr:hypothetical protein MARPO_0068s0018 [Marchantia polymorpha]BBN16707.1 hypothetical protein Mp_7g08640 [Marchantia polymorpha subsp. ruderalis]|eukprot:PTQ35790.1 hypothetical protein MARPO_0068s0018 [Marchantia polymorpha]
MKAESSATNEAQLSADIQKLEVACAELASLPSGRTVYLKKGNLFFRSDPKLVTSQQQRELKKVKIRTGKNLKDAL